VGACVRCDLFAELPGEFSVCVLGRGQSGQQIAHGVITRRLSGTPVEARRLVFHLLGVFAHGVETERSIEPYRTARHKAFDVLAPDQRKKIAKLLAMEIKQQVAMLDLLFGHLVEHPRRVWIGIAKPVREGAVNMVVLVLVRDRER
jgi:hypothetical protein